VRVCVRVCACTCVCVHVCVCVCRCEICRETQTISKSVKNLFFRLLLLGFPPRPPPPLYFALSSECSFLRSRHTHTTSRTCMHKPYTHNSLYTKTRNSGGRTSRVAQARRKSRQFGDRHGQQRSRSRRSPLACNSPSSIPPPPSPPPSPLLSPFRCHNTLRL